MSYITLILFTDIRLSGVNLLDVGQVASLVRKLQSIAKEAGHARPLLIGIDQENGNLRITTE